MMWHNWLRTRDIDATDVVCITTEKHNAAIAELRRKTAAHSFVRVVYAASTKHTNTAAAITVG